MEAICATALRGRQECFSGEVLFAPTPLIAFALPRRFGSRGCCGFLGMVLFAEVFTINLSIDVADRETLSSHDLGFHRTQPKGRRPESTRIAVTLGTVTRRSVEVLIHDALSRLRHADRERLLLHAVERRLEGLQVSDLSSHQKLQCIDRTRIVGVVYEILIHGLRPGLRRNVAPKVDIELAGDVQVVEGARRSLWSRTSL
jgi:hypothetical protein